MIPQSAHELELLRRDRFELRSTHDHSFWRRFRMLRAGPRCRGPTAATCDCSRRARTAVRRQGDVAEGRIRSLNVLARLRAAGRKLRLIMIGEVHSRERELFPDRMRGLGLETAVILLGALTDRREIARYYQLSDAVLFPSQYEQFGIVAIEAAASGRPLLGTPVGIMHTLVPRYEFGLLHRFGDIDRFAMNLGDVLDSPRYRENAAKHRREILSTATTGAASRQGPRRFTGVS